jgi:hypothetical protein
MKSSNLMMTLAGVLCLMLGSAPALAQFMECTNYTYKCPSFTCFVIGGATCGAANYNFNAITQTGIVLGSCDVGNEDCPIKYPSCWTDKYMTDPYAPVCTSFNLVCTAQMIVSGCQ